MWLEGPVRHTWVGEGLVGQVEGWVGQTGVGSGGGRAASSTAVRVGVGWGQATRPNPNRCPRLRI